MDEQQVDMVGLQVAYLFSPTVAVEAAVCDSLAKVVRLYVGRGIKVGDGTTDAQNTVVSTGTETQTVHSHLHNIAALVGKLAVFAREFAAHLGVAVDSGAAFEAFSLYGTGRNDPLTDGSTTLGASCLVQAAHRYGSNLNMDINAIH